MQLPVQSFIFKLLFWYRELFFPTHRSAFLFFCQDRRPAIKAKNPSYTIGNTAKVLGKDWKGLDEEKRKPFEAKAEKDRQR